MKKGKVRTFQSRLREDMKDPEFKTHYRGSWQSLHVGGASWIAVSKKTGRVAGAGMVGD